MKSLLKISLLLLLPFIASTQSQREIDSMRLALKYEANDTIRMQVYKSLGFAYDDINFDSSMYYNEKALAIAQQLQLKLNEAEILWGLGYPLFKMGNYPRALKVLMQAQSIAENPLNEKNTWHLLKGQTPQTYRLSTLGYIHSGFGDLYLNAGNYEKAISAYPKGIRIAEAINDSLLLFFLNANLYSIISYNYLRSNKLDSALYACQKSVNFSETGFDKKYLGNGYIQLGEILKKKGDFKLAKENLNKAIEAGKLYNNPVQTGEAELQLASLFQLQNQFDSSLYYSKEALAIFKLSGKEKSTAAAYKIISDCYQSLGNSDSSFAFLKLTTALNDKIYNQEKEKIKEFQVAGFDEVLKSQELEKEKIQMQNKIRTYSLLAGLAILAIIGFILYRNNKKEKKAKDQLQEKNQIIEQTLSNLKATQAQLIQSEKLASLGKLTAGIAHEIQNPLNFVNNFSELSVDLVKDLKDEFKKPEKDEVYIDELFDDLSQNQEKINLHGKRASSIVKGMLEHSRASTGVKELTDINKLADEYLRLAYHGLRAKDNSFNCDFELIADVSLPKIEVIPQDMGRVLLNLINNAFWAVKTVDKPLVMVKTEQTENQLIIKVTDNGTGMSDEVKAKIFQPFFTTKPTGQGTGLGLSLAYDIVTNGHGGTLEVVSTEGIGSEFIIKLSIV